MSHSGIASTPIPGCVPAQWFATGVPLAGRFVPSAARTPFEGEVPETGVGAGVAAGCVGAGVAAGCLGAGVAAGCVGAGGGALSRLETTDPIKKRRAFHSVFAPSENFAGPCSKRTTNPKVKTESKTNRKTKESKVLMAKIRD